MTRVERDRLKKVLQDFSADAVSSMKTARKLLQSTGIYTKHGTIATEYGGEAPAPPPTPEVPRTSNAAQHPRTGATKLSRKKVA